MQSPKTAPYKDQTANWLSTVSPDQARSWSPSASILETDAPDFAAIPRDKTGARAAAVLALYESDLTNRPAIQCLDWIVSEMRLSRKLRAFATLIVKEAEAKRSFLDGELNRYSHRSTMTETLPVVRNILRVALVEMKINPDTHTAVIISEAVKLSQTFDSLGSGKYVNGILGSIARDSARE